MIRYDYLIVGSGLYRAIFPHSVSCPGGGEIRCIHHAMGKPSVEMCCAFLGISESNFFLTIFREVLKRITREENVQITVVDCESDCSAMQHQTEENRFPDITVSAKRKYEEPLLLSLNPDGKDFGLTIEYDDSLYNEADMRTLLSSIVTLAQNYAESVETSSLKDCSMLTKEEEQQLIVLGAGEPLEYDMSKTFIDLFREQAVKTPDAVAVVDKNSQLTYRELDEASDEYAKSVTPGTFVCIEMPRVKEFVVAVMGIWKTGSAYVPIDTEYPEERKRFMREECDGKPLPQPDIAYMIYTSGSTGKPKGVMYLHSGMMNTLLSVKNIDGVVAGDRCGEYASFCFDMSVEELFMPLIAGASCYIVSEEIRKDIYGLERYFKDCKISGATLPTQVGMMVLNNCDISGMKYFKVAGEKMHPLSKSIKGIKIMNGYGPTECQISNYHIIDSGRSYEDIPIGCSFPNLQSFVVDREMHLIPEGVSGELCISGPQLALGYWNNPELTAERFVEITIGGKKIKVYKTGDLCRWNADGQLEYIGRMDNQVKLRGFRVELGEIESIALKVTGLHQVVAMVRNEQIVLYYTADEKLDDAIRQALISSLPEYMVPSVFVHLDTMPITSNGKIDKKSLSSVDTSVSEVVTPRTLQEQELVDVINDTVRLDSFGVTTNLISVGLTSLSAMRLMMTLSNKYGIQVRMTEFMSNPTVEALVLLLDKGSKARFHFGEIFPVREYYPLTDNQLGIYWDWENNRERNQYNLPYVFKFKNVNAEVLRAAIAIFINAHPFLKMRLVQINGTVMQRRDDKLPPELTIAELPDLPDDGIKSFFQRKVRPFNLFRESLYRFEIFQSGEDCYLFKDIHHIVSDGLSEGLLLREIESILKGGHVIPETYTAYDYSLESEKYAKTDGYREDERYFENLLNGLEATSYPESFNKRGNGRKRCVSTKIKKRDIDRRRTKFGVTSSNYILYSVMQVLKSITRNEKVLICTVSNGRKTGCQENCQGFFVKTLPVVSAESAEALQREILASISHEECQYTKIVEKFGIHPQIMYAYEGEIGTDSVASDIDVISLDVNTPKFPLSITVTRDMAGDYVIGVEYDDGKFSESDMKILIGCISNMTVIGKLVSNETERTLIELGKGERLEYDKSKTFVDMFLSQVHLRPDALSVSDDQENLTYAELDKRADAIAGYLLRNGVKQGDLVPLVLDRTVRFPVAFIGVMKAGAAYVPIDPLYPEERKKYMIEDCDAKVVLDDNLVESIIGSPADVTPVNFAVPDGKAYMIYTSGTTGEPKGALLHHAGLMNFIESVIKIDGLKSSDRVSDYQAFTFDGHVEYIFPTLSVGASVHIMPESIRKDIAAIYNFIIRHKVTGCGFPTRMAELMLQNFDLPVRYVITGGEKLQYKRECKTVIINTYGPTECTVDATYFKIEPGMTYDNIPIGYPMPNTCVLVLDFEGQLVPNGVIGELYISGPQVGYGYWKKENLTDEKFEECPYLPGWKMYRTGDLVRWNNNGQLEFEGRIDSQVKLRGYRIELGEIENVTMRLKGISQTVAVLKNDRIVLYWCGESDEMTIRTYLSKYLAEHMIPSVYVHLDQMPLNSNGKIDRKSLPEPEISQIDCVPPTTDKERFVFEKVSNLLGTDTFGVTDNLKLLGMDSLCVMKLAFDLPPEWGITVSDIMGSMTVRGMLSEKHNVVWFREKYDSSKKTVAVVHGLIGEMALSPLEDELSGHFNVLQIEDIYDTFFSGGGINSLISSDGYNEFLRLYIKRISEVMPADGILSLIIGFSLGGRMAYDIACDWKDLTGQSPVVVMGDSDINVEGWCERNLRICWNKQSTRIYEGRVILLRAVHGHKLNVDVKRNLKKGLLYEIIKWLYWHLHIRDIILSSKTSKVGVLEVGHKIQSKINVSDWKRYKPDIEIVDIDSNHSELFWDKGRIPQYVELIKHEVGE